MKLLLASLIALALFVSTIGAAFAQAATSTSLDMNTVVSAFLPTIAWLIFSILGIVALALAKLLKDKWGWDITAQVKAVEANDRDALHSAILTGLGSAVHQLGPLPTITATSPAGQMILQTVKASVPDAVSALNASDDWIIKAAQAHLQLSDAGTLSPAPAQPVPAPPAVN